jgi:hypothetical protein
MPQERNYNTAGAPAPNPASHTYATNAGALANATARPNIKVTLEPGTAGAPGT